MPTRKINNTVNGIVPSFIEKKYENIVTKFRSVVKFEFTSVHPDTHMRSNQGQYWNN